jgi:hypothetical protein
MKEKTITVQGHFGDLELSKDKFIARWVDSVSDLQRLSWEPEWQDKVNAMKEDVLIEANREFERLYAIQNEE